MTVETGQTYLLIISVYTYTIWIELYHLDKHREYHVGFSRPVLVRVIFPGAGTRLPEAGRWWGNPGLGPLP